MITPVVDERAWSSLLESLPAWQPPLRPTLIVSPHPDDETLGAGGLICWLRQRGVEVTVAAVTDGENAYGDSPGLAQTREREQTGALARLGVASDHIHRFRLVDSSVGRFEKELVEHLLPLASAETHIIAPWQGDFHPDHEACGRAAAAVAASTGALLTSYFFWTWHRGTPELITALPLVSFALGERERLARREALACHVSQLQRPGGDPILPQYLLDPMLRPYEVFLPA